METPLCDMLVFAPHPDDEVIGVGGTILKRTAAGKKVVVCIATYGNEPHPRKDEAMMASKALGVSDVEFFGFEDLHLDQVPHEELTNTIRAAIQKYRPREIYTPNPGDLHTDHKALTAAVMVAIRPKYQFVPELAFAYETLSETGLDFLNPQNFLTPNVYEDISGSLEAKIEALNMHKSQIEDYPNNRCLKAVIALAEYRGMQACMRSAEAFTLLRGYFR